MVALEAASPTTGPVKIACRGLWKVFGPKPQETVAASASLGADEQRRQIQRANHVPAVCDVSFEVGMGEIFVIMGLSGSGKSTIVRCLARLIEPTAGELLIDGEDLLRKSAKELIAVRRRKMAMVFQHFGLLPHLSVLDNVAYPLRVQGLSRAERNRRALEMVALVGLQGRERAFPRELSGGQQQRVGIARSLAADPEIWLLDEPFSALDPLIRRQMQDEFLRLQHLLRKTIVFITHDFLEALRLADRIAIMRDGRFVQVDRPARLILSPADDYVAAFTQDVPRGRVLTAGDIADASRSAAATDRAVSAATLLDDLLPFFVGGARALSVTDASGRLIGIVSHEAVITAIATPKAES